MVGLSVDFRFDSFFSGLVKNLGTLDDVKTGLRLFADGLGMAVDWDWAFTIGVIFIGEGGVRFSLNGMGWMITWLSGCPFDLKESVDEGLIVLLADKAFKVLEDDCNSLKELLIIRGIHSCG